MYKRGVNIMSKEKKTEEFSNDQIARRKLLSIAAYVPPAILGVMIAGNKVAEAAPQGIGSTINCQGGGMITISAGGSACCPCVPASNQYNPTRCTRERCEFGHCPSCGLMTFNSQGQCNSQNAKTPCACTCTQVGTGNNSFWQMTGC
jgi:hypothetical protein